MQSGFDTKILALEKKRDVYEKKMQAALTEEQTKTQAFVEKMDAMKVELKMLETNDSSVASIWKKKCLDLFEVC
jgi:hypothetical protein